MKGFALLCDRLDRALAPPVTDEIQGSVRYIVDGDSLYVDSHDPHNLMLWKTVFSLSGK